MLVENVLVLRGFGETDWLVGSFPRTQAHGLRAATQQGVAEEG